MTRSPTISYFKARQRLLEPPFSDRILTFREVRRAGWDLAGNSDDLSIYGMKPLAWYTLGIRILGRTAVELTRDAHAQFMARSVADTLAGLSVGIRDVIDPFAGSGNMLFHMGKQTGANHVIGFDVHPNISNLTRRNFKLLKMAFRLWRIKASIVGHDWTAAPKVMSDQPTLIVLSPPWGDAFSPAGLDLGRTMPPVLEILDHLSMFVRSAPVFVAIQTYPKMIDASVSTITQQFEVFPTARSSDPYVNGSLDYLLVRLRKRNV